jgi:hypothetical protein
MSTAGNEENHNNNETSTEPIQTDNNEQSVSDHSSANLEPTASEQPIDKQLFKTWGCTIANVDQTKTTRAYFLNVNGIGSSNIANGLIQIYSHMKEIGTGIGMYAECNLDWNFHDVKNINEQHAARAFTNEICAYSCHPEGSGTPYKPGGTMTTMNGSLATRHLESGSDPTGMGRFSYQSIVGRNNTRIIFITAYRVCFQTINSAGPSTSFFQQWHHLRTNGHHDPNPRQQALDDLRTFIHEKIQEGCDVCLGIDANEDSDSRYQHLTTFASACGLVNTHEFFFDDDFYDNNPLPPTFIK